MVLDGLDYSNVQIKEKTFHEKIHPGIDEMEYSPAPANYKKNITKQASIIDKKYPITMGRVRLNICVTMGCWTSVLGK